MRFKLSFLIENHKDFTGCPSSAWLVFKCCYCDSCHKASTIWKARQLVTSEQKQTTAIARQLKTNVERKKP